MDDGILTEISPKFVNDVFYDIQVLSARVNSLVIAANKAPERAEELYLSALATVCAYTENYFASRFSRQNSDYFERFCYSNIYLFKKTCGIVGVYIEFRAAKYAR